MSGGPYISEQELVQWYRLLKKKRFFGSTMLKWEDGQICLIEEQRKMKGNELRDELLKNL